MKEKVLWLRDREKTWWRVRHAERDQNRMHEMGPCQCLRPITFRLLWAKSSSPARAVRSHHGPMWAFRSAVILLTEDHARPRDGIVRQPAGYPMGHYELIV